MSSLPTFSLKLFGSPSIERDGALLTGRVAQRHRIALLALIAMAPGHRLSRDKLIAYLWPESDQEQGRNLLKVSTYVLRTTLGEGALLSEGDDLRLNADVVGVDAAELDAVLEQGNHERAVALYRGPFLDGFFLSDATEFEQWAGRERARLAVGYAKAVEALAEKAEAERDFSRAAERWRVRATQDPYDSRVALRFMQSLDASGNRAGALQHAAVHQRMLQEEFGISAAPEIAALAERLRREPAAEPIALRARETPPAEQPLEPASPVEEVDNASRVVQRDRRRVLGWAGAIALVMIVLLGEFWHRRSVSQPANSIAVLPFINLSPDGDNAYFSDGLTEEIITGLSAVPGLKVISRTSAMHYKGTVLPLRDIAQQLKVAHILEGSVRQSGERVRISAQLIDARSDEHIWAQNYESDRRDMFRVQEQIAREVVKALELELGQRGSTALVKRGTSDPEAYQLYRRGRFLWNTRTKEGHEQAIQYYRLAIKRDSSFADAYAGLADAYSTLYQLNLSTLPEAEIFSRKKWATERALALDDMSADAHVSFATLLQWQWNWPGAEREYRRALHLNPNHATAHSWYALLLMGMGEKRTRDAREESRRAYEVDPFAVITGSNYGWQCYLARDFDCAIEQYQKAIEISPPYARGYSRLGLAYAQKGMLEEALRAMQKAVEIGREHPDFAADLAYVQALHGDTAAAWTNVHRATSQPFEAFNIARAYVALRQPDSAFVWLARSSWEWPHRAVRSDPALDPLRDDPRFAQLSARIERGVGLH